MTTETDYWCRLALTVDEHGGNAFYDVLHNQSNGLPKDPSTLYKELDTKHRQNLSNAFKDQKDLLFPPDQQTHTDKFDITLKILVITNCNIISKNNPKATYVDGIRKLRNKLMHYVNYKFMSKGEFDILWSKLDSCLVGLGYNKDISYMKTKVLDQNETKKILELEKEQKKICNELNSHDAQITANKTEITDHDTRITANKAEITDHDTRITANEAEITDHDTRITANEAEITDHDTRITANKAEITDHDTRITANKAEITDHDTRITALEKKSNLEEKEVNPCKETASNGAVCQKAANDLCKITSNYRNNQDDVILELTSYHSDGISLNDDRIDKILLLSEHNYVLRISKNNSNKEVIQDIFSTIYNKQIDVPDETNKAKHIVSGKSVIGICSHTSAERHRETSTCVSLKDSMVVGNGKCFVVTPAEWEDDCLRYLDCLSHDETNVFTESIEVFTQTDTDVQNLVEKFKRIQKRLLPDAFIGGYNPMEHCKFLYGHCDTTNEGFQKFLVVLRQEPFEILCLSMTFSEKIEDLLVEIQKGCRRVELVTKANSNVVKSIASKPSIYNIIVAPKIETVAMNKWCCKHCLVVPKEIYNDDTKMKEYFDDLPKCGVKKRCKENYKKLASSIIGFVATNAENKSICEVNSHDLIKFTRLTIQQQDILSNSHKNIQSIIQGDYGSGKTIVGLFLLKKIVESAMKSCRVWYVVFLKSEILLQKVQNNLKKFFSVKNNIENGKWCYQTNVVTSKGLSIDISVCSAEDIEGASSTGVKLSSVIRTLQNLHPNDLHHFIIDEYDGESLDSNEAKSLKEVSNVFQESYIVVLVQALKKSRTYDDGKSLPINHDKFKYSETGMTVYEPLKTAMRNPKQIHELITAAKQSISSLENVFTYNDVQKKEHIPISLRLKNFLSSSFNVRNKKKHKPSMAATEFHSSNKNLSEQPIEASTSSQETQKIRSVYPQQNFDVIASELHEVNGGVKIASKMLYHESRLGNKIECEKKPVFVSFKWEDDSERFAAIFLYFKYHFFKIIKTTALFICDDVKHQTIYKKILEFVDEKHILLNDSDEEEYSTSCKRLESNEKRLSIICNTRSSSGCEFPNVVVCVHPEEHHLRHHFVDNVSRCTSYLMMVCLGNYNPTTSDRSDTTLHYVVKDLQRKNLFDFIPLQFDDSLKSWQEHSFDEKSLTTFKINRNSDEFKELCKKSLESSPIKKNLPTRSELLKWMRDGSPINTKKDDDGDNDNGGGAEAANDGNKNTNADEDSDDDGVVGADKDNYDNKTTNVFIISTLTSLNSNRNFHFISSDFDSYSEADIKQLILNEDIKKLKSISSQWPNVVVKSLYNRTPLLWASYLGRADIVKILIDSGANVHVVDSDNQTPLHDASLRGRADIVKILIDSGANVHVGDSDNRTPLHYASLNGYADIVKILIDSGANVHVGDSDNRTPLHYASWNGHADIVKILIDSGANVHVVDSDNQTPLHYASYNGHADIVKILKKHGAVMKIDSRYVDNNDSACKLM